MNRRPPKNGERVQIINTLLVDGNALFKVGFFGAKNEYNHHGEHVGGLYQFITILRKLLNENLYHRVFVFWDGLFSGKLRYEIYSPYKSGRGKDYINGTQPQDESEKSQKEKIWEYLNELGIKQLRHDLVESDDFIAYYCLNHEENEKITICTNDRDMCQLISQDVKIYFCDLKDYVDNNNYSTYFSHDQSNAALIKTIIGDYSDSIRGIKGIKETTLLNLFPEIREKKVTLDEIIKKAKELQEKRIENKQKPLKALNNIISGITDGVQGEKFYEINSALVNLKNPMMTDDAIDSFNKLKEAEFNFNDNSIKNVLFMMKRDGLDKTIGTERYAQYLMPFKKLIQREIR